MSCLILAPPRLRLQLLGKLLSNNFLQAMTLVDFIFSFGLAKWLNKSLTPQSKWYNPKVNWATWSNLNILVLLVDQSTSLDGHNWEKLFVSPFTYLLGLYFDPSINLITLTIVGPFSLCERRPLSLSCSAGSTRFFSILSVSFDLYLYWW